MSGLYPKIYDFENLYAAYLEARKNKRYRGDVLIFTSNLEENLIELQNELIQKTYNVGKYRKFIVTMPKKRLVMALPFRDRVVQWAIYRQINLIFENQFINDSFACQVGKGSHSAVKRLQYWLRQIDRKPDNKWYCLKLDVSKYFYRVDHAALIRILERKIKDSDLLWLLRRLINSKDEAFGLPLTATFDNNCPSERLFNIGMPIGNLTSQMFANLYLNELDHFAKEKLRCKYYIRYMDDILILNANKRELAVIRNEIEHFLDEHLHLVLNRKTSIFPVKLGIEFVGFRVWATHVKLRKSTSKKIKRGLKYIFRAYVNRKKTVEAFKCTVFSYFGIMKHFNSFYLRQKIHESFTFKKG